MRTACIPFSEGWSFCRTNLEASSEEMLQRAKKQEGFMPVEIPHDWLIADSRNLYQDGCGWYTKEFFLADWEGPVILRFDGIYMDVTVFVNGQKIGDWKYGYSTFDMEITKALQKGKNWILVQVRFQAPNSRWYSGAGIYRKVWLKLCKQTYLPMDGSYVVIRPCKAEDFLLTAATEVAGAVDKSCYLRYSLWKEEKIIQKQVTDCGEALSMTVENPLLWEVEKPECYTLLVELCRPYRKEAFTGQESAEKEEAGQAVNFGKPEEQAEAEALDWQRITVGFRRIAFDTEQGLFLNGKHLKLHGVCEHHDFGCLGAAFYTQAMERKLKILKKMGVNALRFSHNMQAPEVLELADKMGFLVINEAFDMWEKSKTAYDYGRFFKEWAERDVRSWVRRDRNHPCLLFWSIGNEIYDTHLDEHGQEITRRLVGYVREHDPEENAPITIGSNYMPWENARKCADIVKFAGYNYGEAYYDVQHKEHPDWIMYGSETASIVQSRGIYHFPLKQSVLADEDEQCSALGNSTTSWGAKSLEKCIAQDRDRAYILGQFLWSGFDYIGEPTPYHTKNSYFGQIDTAGFPKDAYYVFQAEWTNPEKTGYRVHLFPYWDFNKGQKVDVRACTNAAAVELFVNGVSFGRQTIDHKAGEKLLGDWQVVYEPGTITAVAYAEDGTEVARQERSSFGDSAKIRITPDKTEMAADTESLCFLTIETLDAAGNPVENAVDYVQVTVTGAGKLLGLDNGDSTDYDSYQGTVRKLFSGKLLAVIGAKKEAGEINVTVCGKGLIPADCTIQTYLPEEDSLGRHNNSKRDRGKKTAAALPAQIPVRKVELCCQGEQLLTPEQNSVVVQAKVLPQDAQAELVWKVVNAAGIECKSARIEPLKTQDKQYGRREAAVTACGDGEFLVRCMAKQGEKIAVISQLEFQAQGLGTAFLNPYAFVSAGLYTDTLGEIGNGNEKGIATARDGMSGVVYSNLDFGAYGSDEVTLPIFALSDAPYEIEIWLNKPYTPEGRLLQKVIYQKPSQWNVYQEETYHLPERIRGIATLGFVMREKVHLKGFWFQKPQKAFLRLTAAEADAVYGDSFVKAGDAVRNIGNNVTFVYEDMDFTEKGTTRLTVWGRTPLSNNSIHLHFTNYMGETVNRILEFQGGDGQDKAQTFTIEKLTGCGKLEFIFLPGSNFDFVSFAFEKE